MADPFVRGDVDSSGVAGVTGSEGTWSGNSLTEASEPVSDVDSFNKRVNDSMADLAGLLAEIDVVDDVVDAGGVVSQVAEIVAVEAAVAEAVETAFDPGDGDEAPLTRC